MVSKIFSTSCTGRVHPHHKTCDLQERSAEPIPSESNCYCPLCLIPSPDAAPRAELSKTFFWVYPHSHSECDMELLVLPQLHCDNCDSGYSNVVTVHLDPVWKDQLCVHPSPDTVQRTELNEFFSGINDSVINHGKPSQTIRVPFLRLQLQSWRLSLWLGR